ncbi:hypothetical protein SEUCBS140593_006815 [Sporothrix eucalyptigena]|uniref:Heterokaryon incompatibility domain-containing protein n=1 Tax=Sporothrix eucalyptigena TaxID=1812306 RepID=A0ABP0CAJ0_9PEZI
MRLLNVNTCQLEHFHSELNVPYFILSHTWGASEPTYQDFLKYPEAILKSAKIKGLLQMARTQRCNYAWIDTICIDKTSSSELQEAINSMYKCNSLMEDARLSALDRAIVKSRWFTRGWTLQELIAPEFVYFYDINWKYIGEKAMPNPMGFPTGSRRKYFSMDLVPLIHLATSIPIDAIYGRTRLKAYSAAQIMSWAARRKTTRLEDRAYSLMGLFNVNMPMLYGEGSAAFVRLQEEIMKRNDDHSLFAYNYFKMPRWSDDKDNAVYGASATPEDYIECGGVWRAFEMHEMSLTGPTGSWAHHVQTNKGLFITLDTFKVPGLPETLVARLNCIVPNRSDYYRIGFRDPDDHIIVIPLRYESAGPGSSHMLRACNVPLIGLPRKLFTPSNTSSTSSTSDTEDTKIARIAKITKIFKTTKKIETKKRQLYIDNEYPQSSVIGMNTLVLDLSGSCHTFFLSEVYPPALTTKGTTEDRSRILIMQRLNGLPPPLIYLRIQSDWCNLGLLVCLKLKYDGYGFVIQVECSVNVMPPPPCTSLLELLLLNKYPAPLVRPMKIDSSTGDGIPYGNSGPKGEYETVEKVTASPGPMPRD